jgi:hypothetical protein
MREVTVMLTRTLGRRRPGHDLTSRCGRPRRLCRAAARAGLMLLAAMLAAAAVAIQGEAAWAQEQAPEAPGVESIPEVVDRMRLWLIGILFSVAVFYFTLGGFRYMWSNGDPGELEKAKSSFRNAGIGLGLAILAPLVVTIVVGFVS